MENKRYEYKEETLGSGDSIAELSNRLAKDKWRLVSTVPTCLSSYFIMGTEMMTPTKIVAVFERAYYDE